MQEQKEILYLLKNDKGVTICTIRDYIAHCFKTYEMMAAALGPPSKPLLPPANIVAGSATTEDINKYEDEADKEPPSALNVEKNVELMKLRRLLKAKEII